MLTLFNTFNSPSAGAQRRLSLALILLVLLTAAVVRLTCLTWLPPGFSTDEIRSIQVTETMRQGTIASLYNVGDPASGYEGLFPIFQVLTTTLIGPGLLCYRVVSFWCGLISVALVYAFTQRLFGSYAGLIAAIAMTVTLWPVLLARSAIRETLLLPLSLALLLVLARALHLKRLIEPNAPVTLVYTSLGVLLSMMAYTHWTGLLGGGIVLAYVAYLIVARQPISRRVIGHLGFSLLVVTILGIPYLVVSLRSFSMSGIHAFWANRPENVGVLLGNIVKTLASLVVVGDPLPQHNVPGAPLIGLVGALFLGIGLWVAIRRLRAANTVLPLVALGFGLLPGIWSRGAPNFANLVLAIPPIMALIGLGAATTLRQVLNVKRLSTDWRALLLAAAATAGSLVFLSGSLFGQWANNPDTNLAFHGSLGRLAAFLDRTRDNLTTSICTLNLYGSGARISDPALFGLMVHRQNIPVRFSDCMTGLVMTEGGAPQRFAYADISAASSMPEALKRWVKHAAVVPVSGLPDGSILKLNVEKDLADTVGALTLGHVEWSPETVGPAAQVRLPVRMGGYLTFQGYLFPAGAVYKPGDTVTVVTYWRADGAQAPDLRIFAHILRNPDTEPAAQNDLLSVDGGLLQNRDIFIQIIAIPLPPDFPDGDYSVSVGAYHADSGERLPIYDSNYERGNRLFLNVITVKAAQ